MSITRSKTCFGAKPTLHLSTPLSKPGLWTFRKRKEAGEEVQEVISIFAKFYYEAAMIAAREFHISVQDTELVASPFMKPITSLLVRRIFFSSDNRKRELIEFRRTQR